MLEPNKNQLQYQVCKEQLENLCIISDFIVKYINQGLKLNYIKIRIQGLISDNFSNYLFLIHSLRQIKSIRELKAYSLLLHKLAN